MAKPNSDTKYILVRINGGRVEQAEYTRFDDDSVFIVAEGYSTVIEFSPGEWELAWADLESRGFVEWRQARDSGIVPLDWQPAE